MKNNEMILIGAAVAAAFYLYNKSKQPVTIAPKSSIMPIYQPPTIQQQLINTGISTAGKLIQSIIQPPQNSVMPIYQQQSNFNNPGFSDPSLVPNLDNQSSYDNFQNSYPSMYMSGLRKNNYC